MVMLGPVGGKTSSAAEATLAGEATRSAKRQAHRVLVLGGARSGKSFTAEGLLAEHARVEYVATGAAPEATDVEWAARVRAHQERRPPGWQTLETLDVEGVLGEPGPVPALVPVLIECLSTWLARVMEDCGIWTGLPGADQALAARLDRLVQAWRATSRHALAVSNEVGSGVVPGSVSGRRYRDELGRLNARIAASSEDVWLCTAGIAQRLR
jgi:adenosylcobinamide kinase / adenosylcobinamide-phosphate guanylyltransferase